VGDEILTFKPLNEKQSPSRLMRDQETGTLWDRVSGKAIEGRLKGQSILPVIAVPWLKERWRQIYDKGIIYKSSS
jgi:hypothetical protein